MGAREIFNFIRHLNRIYSASGNKRLAYALANAVLSAVMVGLAFLIKFLVLTTIAGSIHLALGIVLIAVVGFVAVMCFLQGFLGQIAVFIFAGYGIFVSDEKTGNAVSFTIALITLAGVAVGIVFLVR